MISLFLRPIALSAILLVAAACSPLTAIDSIVPDDGYKREADVAYGADPRQKLDIYRPLVTPRREVIVFFYGGGWRRGSRDKYRFIGQTFASEGYITVVADYRIYPQVRFPAFVEDGAKAVAWVERNLVAGERGRIILMGHSAGAHTAALLALDQRYLADAGTSTDAIGGWVGLSGPYDFDPFKYGWTRRVFQGVPDRRDVRPINFVRAGAPPTLLLHGTQDQTVSPRNSEAMAKRLSENGVDVRYVPVKDLGHGPLVVAMAKPFRGPARVVETIDEFIVAHEAVAN